MIDRYALGRMNRVDLYLFHREWQLILASFFMRFSGTLSFTGSAIIIYMILSDRCVKLKRIHNRFLLGMSLIEIFSSAAWIMAVSATPKGTLGSYGAVGNQATCTLQGFLFQLGFGVPFYNLSLCLYHCLVIRFNVSDATISKRLEPFLHALSLLFPLATALAGIPMQMYNFKGAVCYIEPSPWQCRYNDSCTRNPHSLVFEFWLGGFWLIFIGCSVIVLMTLVYCSVRHRQRTMSQFNFKTRDGTVVLSSSYVQLCKDKRETGIQAFLYVSAFIITFIWSGINYFFSVADSTPPDALRLLIFLFQPLQGFWNFFIYMRPRYCLISNLFPDKTFGAKLVLVIFYPEMGRRQSSAVSPRVQPSTTAAANTSASRFSLIHTKDGTPTAPLPIVKDIETLGDSDDLSSNPLNNNNPSTQEELNRINERGKDSGLSIEPRLESRGEVDDPPSSRSNTSQDIIRQPRRRMSHVAIAFNVADDVVDHRLEVSQEESSMKSPARRRKSLISIAFEDKCIIDDHATLPPESWKAPPRRRSLISISLDDMNRILAEDPEG